MKGQGRSTTAAEIAKRVAFLGPHGLLTFSVPQDASDDTWELALQIGGTDKRAHRELGFGTARWEAVIQLLTNAIQLGVLAGKLDAGRRLVAEADALLDRYVALPGLNRAHYLFGLGIGAVLVVVVAVVLAATKVLPSPMDARELVTCIVFAVLGSIASVIARIDRHDALDAERTTTVILTSAATRPVLAGIFGATGYCLLKAGIVNVAAATGASPLLAYSVVCFMCGFSERFAQELLGYISPRARDARTDATPASAAPEADEG